MIRIGLIAGEISGDMLGASLIAALKKRLPNAQFEGIAGAAMIEQGCKAIFPAERLAVMGLTEVLRRYGELRTIREQIIAHFKANPPDVFIGIDAPDFNLDVELALKQIHVPTIHYVSPSVWAWRQYRIHKIAKAVDRMLTLFPFEADFYRRHQVPVTFVGHPLADMIPFVSDRQTARLQLDLPLDIPIIAILPGSRMSEVSRLAKPFLETARWCQQQRGNFHFVAPLATLATRQLFDRYLQDMAPMPLTVLNGHAREAMAAADVVLLASGTATLEALLINRPMVVAYKVSWLTYWWAKSLLKINTYALPNLLANKPLVAEHIQHNLAPEQLGAAMLRFFDQPQLAQQLSIVFQNIHAQLRQGASERAADAVMSVLNKREN